MSHLPFKEINNRLFMKVKFRGIEYEYKPTGKKSKRGGGADINGYETDRRTVRQYGLYNEHGEKIYTCGSGGYKDQTHTDIYYDGKKVGRATIIPTPPPH